MVAPPRGCLEPVTDFLARENPVYMTGVLDSVLAPSITALWTIWINAAAHSHNKLKGAHCEP